MTMVEQKKKCCVLLAHTQQQGGRERRVNPAPKLRPFATPKKETRTNHKQTNATQYTQPDGAHEKCANRTKQKKHARRRGRKTCAPTERKHHVLRAPTTAHCTNHIHAYMKRARLNRTKTSPKRMCADRTKACSMCANHTTKTFAPANHTKAITIPPQTT